MSNCCSGSGTCEAAAERLPGKNQQRGRMKKGSPGIESRTCKKRPVQRKGDTALSVSAQQFSEHAIRGLIDDWIVPALVEQFLQDREEAYPGSPDLDHN